ncbi:MAG: hypothetical protein HOM15_05120 [Gammaproteobacteria bacterium]|nr:hypothetical protein [Gammaproteobacteria bacterium]MBT6420266.1 hypothetical protein [Gammaproteobacteria bacterium]MBT7436193.1 hypothetical protein [Gammaproteobacteria bacterium]
MISDTAAYRERVILPSNAVFEATLEGVSLMDVAVILGPIGAEPVGASPSTFAIEYKTEDIKPGHRDNVGGKITLDGQLKFITDTLHPVLTGKDKGGLKMIKFSTQAFK